MTIRRRPFTNLWYKVYSHIVRQGHYLSGLPFSITNDSCSLSIPPGSDRRFKLYMVWFTFYNLIYVLNYIYILLWGTEVDFKNQTFCMFHTFVNLVVWCMMLTALVKSHQMGLVINNIIDFMGRFNGMSYFIAIHFPFPEEISLMYSQSPFSPMETKILPKHGKTAQVSQQNSSNFRSNKHSHTNNHHDTLHPVPGVKYLCTPQMDASLAQKLPVNHYIVRLSLAVDANGFLDSHYILRGSSLELLHSNISTCL
jgi:hypothetical protein